MQLHLTGITNLDQLIPVKLYPEYTLIWMPVREYDLNGPHYTGFINVGFTGAKRSELLDQLRAVKRER